MSELYIWIVGIWIFSVLASMYLVGLNNRIVYVRNLVFAILFGPLNTLYHIGDMDVILWRAKEKQ
jgi:hypothetical protein